MESTGQMKRFRKTEFLLNDDPKHPMEIQMSPCLPFTNVTGVGDRAAGGCGAPAKRSARPATDAPCSKPHLLFIEPRQPLGS